MNRKELLVAARSTLKEFGKDDVSLLAAGVTYYAFFSLFPLLLLGITLAGIFLKPEDATKFIFGTLSQAMGSGSIQLLQSAMVEAFNNRHNAGLLALVSVVTLAFSASSAFETLDKAINRAWDSEKIPSLITAKLTSVAMMLGVAVLLLLSVVASTAISTTQNATKQLVGEVPGSQIFWEVVTIGVSLGLVFLIFLALYRFVPRREVSFRDVWLGALLAATGWELVKELFAFYLGSSFVNYSAVYGTMGTVIALLTWIYISTLIILVGAEFTSEVHRVRTMHAQLAAEAVPKHQGSPWFSNAYGSGVSDIQ